MKTNMTLEQVKMWYALAVIDGWTSVAYEIKDNYMNLKKDGFVVHANMRSEREAEISIWCPDGLAIEPTEVYSMEAIKENMKLCSYCRKKFEKTVRIGFAGRCCEPCREKNVDKVEYKGWTN